RVGGRRSADRAGQLRSRRPSVRRAFRNGVSLEPEPGGDRVCEERAGDRHALRPHGWSAGRTRRAQTTLISNDRDLPRNHEITKPIRPFVVSWLLSLLAEKRLEGRGALLRPLFGDEMPAVEPHFTH